MPIENIKETFAREHYEIDDKSDIMDGNNLHNVSLELEVFDIKQFVNNMLENSEDADIENYLLLEKKMMRLYEEFNRNNKLEINHISDLADIYYGHHVMTTDIFKQIIQENNITDDFIIELSNKLLNDKNVNSIFTAFYLLINIEYSKIKAKIPNISEILQTILELKVLEYAIIVAMYKWEEDELLIEYFKLKSPYDDNYLQNLFIEKFSPLRAGIAKNLVLSYNFSTTF